MWGRALIAFDFGGNSAKAVPMSKQHKPKLITDGRASLEARLTHFEELFEEFHEVLQTRIALLRGVIEDAPPGDKDQKAALQAVHELLRIDLDLTRAQQTLQERHDDDTEEDAVDFEEIRAEIGRRLDRIRDARSAEGLSGQLHADSD